MKSINFGFRGPNQYDQGVEKSAQRIRREMAARDGAHLIGILSAVALLVIGCLGAAGVLPGATIGWTVMGLAGGTFLIKLAANGRKIGVLTVITTALLVALGILGGTGVLSAQQVGWSVIGILVMSSFSLCVATRVKREQAAFTFDPQRTLEIVRKFEIEE